MPRVWILHTTIQQKKKKKKTYPFLGVIQFYLAMKFSLYVECKKKTSNKKKKKKKKRKLKNTCYTLILWSFLSKKYTL